MKRVGAFCLAVVLLFSCSGCCIQWESPEETVSRLDDFFSWLGQFQITQDEDLIGTRSRTDDYTGDYQAECAHINGRDVIFGGTSVKERHLNVSVVVETKSGQAVLRIRKGSDVKEYTPSSGEPLEIDLKLSGGGNYLMLDYEDFSGTVQLHAVYSE